MGVDYTRQKAYLLEVSQVLSALVEKGSNAPEALEPVREGMLNILHEQLSSTKAFLGRLNDKPARKSKNSEATENRRQRKRDKYANQIVFLEKEIVRIRNGKDISEWLWGDLSAENISEVDDAEEIVKATMYTFGLHKNCEIVKFDNKDQEYEDYDFELDTLYVQFDDDALIVEVKQGRKTTTEPTPAYESLCRFLDIKEIKVYNYIFIIA